MGHLLINLDRDTHNKLKHLAIDRGVSLEALTCDFLRRAVNDPRFSQVPR